jgi:hypothetical protein
MASFRYRDHTRAVPGAWLTNSGRRAAVTTALNLIPFAGIAFLWVVGVVRVTGMVDAPGFSS